MPKDRLAKCPAYITRSRSGKKRATITCEKVENNLGFDAYNQVLLNSHEEEENFYELFCCDMFEACPFYQAIYQYRIRRKKVDTK